jgi:PLP dependent protein
VVAVTHGRFDVRGAVASARSRMADAGGTPDGITIVAVTKGFGPEAVSAAIAAGLTDIGENYAQELLEKRRSLGLDDVAGAGGVRWHFLGTVQRNKVPALAPVVSCWQGLSRLAEGEAIARRRPGAAVLVEVELTGVEGRNGCRPEEVPFLVTGLRGLDLDVRGLMTVAPTDPVRAAEAFRAVRRLADDLGLPERSMGMSDDFPLAVREGATMVRLGRALFGDRPPRKVSGQ